jgi:hypothetical protein
LDLPWGEAPLRNEPDPALDVGSAGG